jgi:hypothetical protein
MVRAKRGALCYRDALAPKALPSSRDAPTIARAALHRCEWSALAFALATTTISINSRSALKSVQFGACIACSTACALLLPFATTQRCWYALLVAAVILYSSIWPATLDKLHDARAQPMPPGDSGSPRERERARCASIAARLICICNLSWSVFIAIYFWTWLVAPSHGGGSGAAAGAWGVGPARSTAIPEHPRLHFLADCVADLFFKLLYAALASEMSEYVQSYFEHEARIRFTKQMGFVWHRASDVIVISTRLSTNCALVETIASGSLAALIGQEAAARFQNGCIHAIQGQGQRRGQWQVREQGRGQGRDSQEQQHDSPEGQRQQQESPESQACGQREGGPRGQLVQRKLARPTNGLRDIGQQQQQQHQQHEQQLALERIRKASEEPSSQQQRQQQRQRDACCEPAEPQQPFDFELVVSQMWLTLCASGVGTQAEEFHASTWILHADDSPTAARRPRHCEVVGSRLADSSAIVLVVRDVTDRVERHQAEKALISEIAEKRLLRETVSRQKDEEANRFTRHEVKNGILVSIAAADGFLEMHEQARSAGEVTSSAYDLAFLRRLGDLRALMQGTLDLVLAQAMARDVTHGSYSPAMERVQLEAVLDASAGRADRFELGCAPSPFPALFTDPQLLFLIHRNALSNACKYGAKGAAVRTELEYDGSVLVMRVVNQNGRGHARLLTQADSSRAVFEKGRRLHLDLEEADGAHGPHGLAAVSAGDGCWIMQKCAEALHGRCAIEFGERETTFTLECPARLFVSAEQIKRFELPAHARAIGIDDSRVQRFILTKMFGALGASGERVRVLGGTDEEITSFAEIVAADVRAHPSACFLIVVDENLELSDHSRTVSGSALVKRARDALGPELEKRLCTLVRSANDSPSDRLTYCERAHGVLPKEPFDISKVLDRFAPLWIYRFPTAAAEPRPLDEATSKQIEMSVIDEVVEIADAVARLRREKETWAHVWPHLHQIKGQLLSLEGNAGKPLIAQIEAYREATEYPADFDAWLATLRRTSDGFREVALSKQDSSSLIDDAGGEMRAEDASVPVSPS